MKQAARCGQKAPEYISNAPSLTGGLDFYLQAFFDLNSERFSGFAAMPIPWRALQSYAEYYGLDNDDFEDFQFILRKMDDAYLDTVNKNGNTPDSSKKDEGTSQRGAASRK